MVEISCPRTLGHLKEFWSAKELVYDRRNAEAKCFFEDFQHDPEKHAKILSEHALHRKIKWILNTDAPYNAPVGLLEPKLEPAGEDMMPLGFMYRFRNM